ncbi:folylpolyglutamate synthase [Imshaugia aleurites]|uniref:Dihydrofolate synthetase n=1 Tax=Imshaugia aleurites TaxID=172621 RepID=A0A8H3F2Y5_9LECA|nr:folylpolyglutamate synthase [Imshaugia aleurites]
MIELGLARITRLLKNTPIPWRAIHVAGTNGKGSVCSYASAMLNAGNISCGRFTSPHLVDRWDCITINEKIVDEDLFREVEAVVKTKDQSEDIKASEFEILTATAFEIFNRKRIEIGVVEVGLGGRNDATNVLEHPAVTVITKIGKDHQSFLGSTLEEIAFHKAGIMKKGVHCIADGSSTTGVLAVLSRNAAEVRAASLLLVPQNLNPAGQVWNVVAKGELMDHQQMNVCLAFEAVKQVLSHYYPSLDPLRLLPSITKAVWPGRLQILNIRSLVGKEQEILLDGAHNSQSAEVLGTYVDQRLREKHCPVTWMIAISKGKDVPDLLRFLLRSGDNLIAVEFGPVDGMPWIWPEEADEILGAARDLGISKCSQTFPGSLSQALRLAVKIADGGPLVAAGSLYLVSDVLRLLEQAKPSGRMNGSILENNFLQFLE